MTNIDCIFKNPSLNVWRAALDSDYKVLRFAKNLNKDLCKLALSIEPKTMKYIENLTEDLKLHIVNRCWRSGHDVKKNQKILFHVELRKVELI